MELFSPAKINLGLRILYKRETDNYHELESIFVKLNWGDIFKISENNFFRNEEIANKESSTFYSSPEIDIKVDFRMSSEKMKMLLPSFQEIEWNKNLILRAYQKVKEVNPKIPKIFIHLTKIIPPGAGLGGGSSNAACILQFFQQSNYVSYNTIQDIAPKLGADVPFFLIDGSAWVTGIGEELESIRIPRAYGVLAVPTESLSTPLMYAKLKSPLQKPRPSKRWKSQEGRVLTSLENGDWKSLRTLLVNDFEKVAYEIHPNLLKIRDTFYGLGSDYSSLTGSGSSIYGLMKTIEQQEIILNQMETEFPNLEVIPFSF
ncbi:MAG: 4-(cytidine 5'-diphospho)-2-C-methyl-D-erythritol kinase [Leptospira sp.]|nr:4-(cytidine 5'-diphospho)-2-C-methyl-D-erythritol kinase [Leptospira sp.]NCS94208.1 4-(cytidine 5'-diphospho)-2-C-methyl-D-erythritol kinase [Leptospira sp.]